MGFGTVPYRRAWYLDILEPLPSEMRPLAECLVGIREGDLTYIEALVPFLSASSFPVRQYAQQLFADVCSNDQVGHFEAALESSETMDETKRVVLRLGETLSLAAIPILLDWRDEYEDPDVDEYVVQALETVFPVRGIDEFSIGEVDTRELYGEAMTSLDRSQYYFRGKPIFLGDVTKDLLTCCAVAYKEKENCVLYMQPQILSNFSGIRCPAEHGQPISDDDMGRIVGYVKTIAAMSWKHGSKYFFGHEVAHT
jgi:hypothetical protein